MESVEIDLPNGLAVAGQWCRRASLRPVTGHEEDFLLQEGNLLSPAQRATQLLTCCLTCLGPAQLVAADAVRRLSVGDREALLFHLRWLTLGDRISCVLSCPSCSAKMDLDLKIRELLLPPYPNPHEIHEVALSNGEASFHVRFRLPNGADQEAAAPVASTSVTHAAELVLRRCVEEVIEQPSGAKLSELPQAVLHELPGILAELDPQADILLDLTCPECGVRFVLPFDIADYFFRELAAPGREFYREVHALSFHYHWSQMEILSLSRRKRHLYLELLAEELRGSTSS